ncbi:MAG: Single-stranded DNA-binding protein [Anaerolinea thermophila]|uniref:Single-stranded DNA-binding protein n=1 Tax=Anaerolinea thermophila TaxID=167964 RepID=A0A117LGP3_9CHLR|nr:MAG: Single-stranded DNA-binding protein [Anaerolinea thermophila]
MSFHTIIIVGRLGQDPEMRYMPNGQAVTNFSVASDRAYRNANGDQVRVTTWFRVSVWGKQAESCNQYLNKGSMVLIEGTLNPDKESGRPRIWTTADGRTGSSYEVNAQTVRFLSTRGGGQEGGTESEGNAPEIDENDIPF